MFKVGCSNSGQTAYSKPPKRLVNLQHEKPGSLPAGSLLMKPTVVPGSRLKIGSWCHNMKKAVKHDGPFVSILLPLSNKRDPKRATILTASFCRECANRWAVPLTIDYDVAGTQSFWGCRAHRHLRSSCQVLGSIERLPRNTRK